MTLFLKLHHMALADHIKSSDHCVWYYIVPYAEIFSFVYSPFHMVSKGGNWLCLSHFLRAHFSLSPEKVVGARRSNLHSKLPVCRDRISSVKRQI